jgi:hypothetical protein
MSYQDLFMPTSTKSMKPEEFVALTDKQKENIESSRFVPPTIGSKNFGHVQVKFKTPVLVGMK